MRKGTLIIVGLLVLIVLVGWLTMIPHWKATSVSTSGQTVNVADNESNIRTARGALAWDSVRLGTIYYYYVDGRPENGDLPRTTDIVAMPGVTEAEAIRTVQESLKKGTFRIIALRTKAGEELTTCPYVVGEAIRDNAFG